MSNAKRRHRRRWRAERTRQKRNARNLAHLMAFEKLETEEEREAYLDAHHEFAAWSLEQLKIVIEQMPPWVTAVSDAFDEFGRQVRESMSKLLIPKEMIT